MSESHQLYAKLCAAARELNSMDDFGALHIVVADCNMEDEHLEYCLADERITPEETDFCRRWLENLTEQQRNAAWAFRDCQDIYSEPSQSDKRDELSRVLRDAITNQADVSDWNGILDMDKMADFLLDYCAVANMQPIDKQ